MKKTPVVLLGLMLIAAESSSALSLGRHRGAALIGRPLDITIQAVIDSQEDASSLCVDADVFYADNKLSPSRIQVTTEKASTGGQDAVIRVRSSVPVDEPVVTVYLRAGCRQRTEKRFVMLADLASEPASLPALPMPAAAQPPRGNAGNVTAPGPSTSAAAAGSAGAGPESREAVPARASRRSRARAAEAAAQAPNAAVAGTQSPRTVPTEAAAASAPARTEPAKRSSRRAREAAAAEKGGSRLKLEPLDLTIDRDPQLRSSSELLSVPSSSPQERSAAAALWRALTAQPQDILRDTERLQTLESSVRSLQVQGQKNKAAIEDLNGQVQQAQSERYSNPLVYALGLLLVLALAALAYVASRWAAARTRKNDELPWWRKNEPLEKGWGNSAPDAGESSLPGDAAPGKPSQKEKAAGLALDLDLDLDLGASPSSVDVKYRSSRSAFDSLPPLSRKDRSDFGMSMGMGHPGRAVKAEELFDVQQQADFFVSLGQYEQAIEVLRNHIGDNVQTSALVYLDLFNLYHQLKRQADYETLREDFNQRFNAKIPAFEFYNEAGSGLEAYQTALGRIEALWPSPKVLDVIEESLFRRAGTGDEAFNLEAYRELLMLYSVAREIISPDATVVIPKPKFDLPHLPDDYDVKTTKFLATSIQPLSASVVPERQPSVDDRFLASAMPPASPRLGLDLDLSDFGGESESPMPELESDSRFFAQFAADVSVEPPAPARATPPSRASEEIDNLIDFDAFDSSIPDDYKTNPPKT